MKHSAVLSILLLVCASSLLAQADVATAPAIWESYKVGRHELSVDLPKMPVRIGSQDMCSDFQKHSFFSYADQTVYEVTVVAKIALPIPAACKERRLFSDGVLAERLAEVRSGKPEMAETSTMLGDRQAYRFAGETDVRWIIPAMQKDRWIELAVVRRKDKKSFEEAFVKSLDLTGATGKEVGQGAPAILGDPRQATEAAPAAANVADSTTPADSKQIAVMEPLQIVAKPKASYTDEARKANVRGTVRMRITLLSNGSVGAITPVTELSHGLTEQAILAARKIVFLPARVGSVAASRIILVEYGFNIY